MGGEQVSISTLSISGLEGELFVSSWSSERLGNGAGTVEGKGNVAWSFLNGGEKIFDGTPNHLSLYSSLFNGFSTGWRLEYGIYWDNECPINQQVCRVLRKVVKYKGPPI